MTSLLLQRVQFRDPRRSFTITFKELLVRMPPLPTQTRTRRHTDWAIHERQETGDDQRREPQGIDTMNLERTPIDEVLTITNLYHP